MTSITVGTDDYPLFREGKDAQPFRNRRLPGRGEGATRYDAAMIAADKHPDVMLVDVSAPGGGLSAIVRSSVAQAHHRRWLRRRRRRKRHAAGSASKGRDDMF